MKENCAFNYLFIKLGIYKTSENPAVKVEYKNIKGRATDKTINMPGTGNRSGCAFLWCLFAFQAILLANLTLK